MVDGEVLSFVVAHTGQLSAMSRDEDAFAQKGLFGISLSSDAGSWTLNS